MTDELKPGTEPATIGDDETTRTPVTPPPSAAPAPAVPPMTPAWDPVGADPTGTAAWTPVAPTTPVTPASRASSADASHDNDVAWAVSAPVVASGASSGRRRGGRVRWAAALAIVVLILGTTAAVAAIIAGRATESTVIGYAPANTTMYMEVRLDLPGDQRQAIGAFLQKFPGFKDQAALDTKLDEVLDDLVREATDNQQTYTGDIKPWFDGELAYSMGPLPPAAALKDPSKSIGDLPRPGPGLDQGSSGRADVARRPADQGGRDLDHGGLSGRHHPPVPGVGGRPAGLRDRRRQGHRDRRRGLCQGRHRYQRFRRLRR